MAQAVYDNDYVVDAMTAAGWPLRWQPMGSAGDSNWASSDGGRSYETAGGEGESWIRYQHFTPDDGDWREMERHGHVTQPPLPHLITDFYAYNTGEQRHSLSDSAPTGLHWVGDLMLEATLDVRQSQGSVVLDLVKGGRHFQCTLDVQTGQATLAIDGLPDFAPTAQNCRWRRGASSPRLRQRRSPTVAMGRRAFGGVFGTDDVRRSRQALPTDDDLAPAGVAARRRGEGGAFAAQARHLLHRQEGVERST